MQDRSDPATLCEECKRLRLKSAAIQKETEKAAAALHKAIDARKELIARAVLEAEEIRRKFLIRPQAA